MLCVLNNDMITNGQSMRDVTHKFLEHHYEVGNMRFWSPPRWLSCFFHLPADLKIDKDVGRVLKQAICNYSTYLSIKLLIMHTFLSLYLN